VYAFLRPVNLELIMTTDTHFVATTTSPGKEKSLGLRAAIQEITAIGIIVAVAAQVVVIADIKAVVKKNNDLLSQQVTVTHASALVTQQALALLEGREVTGEAKGFVMPPKD
jgi:hypothetical protein